MPADAQGLFVAGTDTGVGKSLISAALLHRAAQEGLRVAGYKPVAAGCEHTPQGLRNEDAQLLRQYANLELPYGAINPYALEPAIAPHIAAQQQGVELQLEPLLEGYTQLARQADWVVVEGAGGWAVPLNERHTLGDLAQALALPVVLVVGIRLGCISHALLTQAAIQAAGLSLVGWVANRVDPHMACAEENVAALAERLQAPLLGEVPWQSEPSVIETAAGLSRP